MSRLNRNQLKRIILKEFKMMGMADMGHGGMKPMGMIPSVEYGHDHGEMEHGMDHSHSMMKSPKSCVSREDCCAAIMCLVECCECPVTKRIIMECCQDILAGAYDHK